MTSLIDLTNYKIGKLTIVHRIKRKNNPVVYWLCRCECGNMRTVNGEYLRKNRITSCKECAEYKFKGASNMGDAAFNSLYKGYERNAKSRNIKFSLSKEQFRIITSSNCFYCDKSPSQNAKTSQSYRGNYIYNGIDRVDNTIGYVVNNCVSCCKTCNRAKYQQTQQEFGDWIKSVYKNMFS